VVNLKFALVEATDCGEEGGGERARVKE